MRHGRFGRVLGTLVVVAMAAVPIAVGALSTPAGASGAVTVSTAAGLKTAWVDVSTTHITLTADIQLGNSSTTCGSDAPTRGSGGSGIVVDGQGLFGITTTCTDGRLLADLSGETVTLTGLTHFDGGTSCDVGGGLAAEGPVVATNASFSNNFVGGECFPCSAALTACGASSAGFVHADPVLVSWIGGAIYSGSDVTLTNSTFSGNHADTAGGAVYAVGNVVSTGSTFTGNSAGRSGELETELWGGAIAGEQAITVDASTFTGNFIGDSNGTCAVCIIAGGAIAQSQSILNSVPASASAPAPVTVTDARFEDNHADCAYYCITQGGAVAASSLTSATSAFIANSANLGNCNLSKGNFCDSAGGAVASPTVSDTGSTFTANQAEAAGCSDFQGCYNQGGAIAVFDLALAGTAVTGNDANCDTNCAAYGGGISAGEFLFGAGAKAAAAGFNGPGSGPGGVFAQASGGTVSITQSNIADNSALCDTGDCGVSGGGLLAIGSDSVDVTASTFSGNTAGFGGAMAVYQEGTTPVTIKNSTVTGNSSWYFGALDLTDSDTTLAYDTIVDNIVSAAPVALPTSAAAGGWNAAHGAAVHAQGSVIPVANLTTNTLTSFGTIVALPQGAPNCLLPSDTPGSTTSQGYNWSDDTSCGFTNATDKVATPNDPELNALGDWGGPTPTMLPFTLKSGGTLSPVIDAIPAAACQTGAAAGITTDQRGVVRPQLNGCDIGAVEVTLADILVESLAVQPKFTG